MRDREIVFVNRYFHPDQSATSQMLSELAFDLAALGWRVSVIAGGQLYHEARAKLPERERLRGVEIHRVSGSRWGRAGLVGRALDYLSFGLAARARVARIAQRAGIVVTMTDPPLASLLIDRVARRSGARVVNWMQDVFPEVAAGVGVLSHDSCVARRLVRMRAKALARADAVVAVGEHMRERLIAGGARPEQTLVIENWADVERIAPVAHADNPLRAKWGLGDRFVVGYSGNFGRAHEFGGLLEAIERLRQRRDIMFLFIGAGAQLDAVRTVVRERDLDNVVLQPFQDAGGLANSLSAADVHVVSLKPALEGLVVPSKFYGAIAAGRPVLFLGDREGATARAVRKFGCGETVDPTNGAVIASAIARLADSRDRCSEFGRRARAAALEHGSRERGVREWNALLRRLIENERA